MSTLSITSIQTKLFWENKAANLRMLQEKIESIPDFTEIVVLPEMFNTGFSMQVQELAEPMNGPSMEWMQKIAADNKLIVTGSLIIKADNKFYNRLIWMLPNGEYGYYDKRHLFAYAGEDKYFTAGTKKLIASVKGWKINLQVCYDLRFPVWGRQPGTRKTVLATGEETTEPAFDVFINVANWPAARSHAWKTLLCARAIENQCYVVGVNRVGKDSHDIEHSGNSIMIDPLGEVLYHMADDEDIFTILLRKEELQNARNRYPFWRDADAFSIQV